MNSRKPCTYGWHYKSLLDARYLGREELEHGVMNVNGALRGKCQRESKKN